MNLPLLVVGPPVGPYFVVKSAVRAGVAAAGKVATTPPGLQPAREILDARFARGEIGPEDYGRTRARPETP